MALTSGNVPNPRKKRKTSILSDGRETLHITKWAVGETLWAISVTWWLLATPAQTLEVLVFNTSARHSQDTQRYVNALRPWCPTPDEIYPCKCDGPQGFPFLVCDKLLAPYALTRALQVQFPVREYGKFSLTNSEVPTLEKHTLDNLQLEYIYARKNSLKTIESGAFDSSRESLKRIEIIHNDVEKFPFKSLTGFRKLEYLQLKYNAIKKIPDYAFAPNSKLRVIDLSFNKINYIGSYAFKDLTNLEKLDLRYNKLTVLNNHAFAVTNANPKLRLNLSHNKIIMVADGAFENQVPLALNMSDNILKKFKEDLFSDMLKGMVQSHTGHVYVERNRLRCTCEMVGWLLRLPQSYLRHVSGFTCTDQENRNLQDLTLYDIGCTS